MYEDYAKRYRDLYERHWWWRAREEVILSTLERLRPAGGFGRILDVGCGDGLLFSRLQELGDPEGIEADPAAVDPGGPWSNRIHIGSFDETFRPERTYGLVLLLDVLEHMEDPARVLAEAFSRLDPGGSVLITVPAFLSLWTSHDVLNHHVTRYTRQRLETLVRVSGGVVAHCAFFFRWMTPFKLLLHWKEAVIPAPPVTPRIPSNAVNRLLYGLSIAEQRVIGAVPIPFGSSLIAVARRSS
jgi:SAM-dependent methyltransferase